MGFAVGRAEKGKGSGGGLGHHIDRTKGQEYSYEHADPSRTHLNINIGVSNDRHKMSLQDAISDRIEKGYNGKRKIRNDAVRYLKHVYTGSHEDMKRIFSDSKTSNAWIKANVEFVSEEYGKENIVRFTLHLDEKTPHLHVITVPLTKDGRLSAKEVMGSKKELSLRQDRYAEAMKNFGLERGIKATGIKHEDANDYYKRVDYTLNIVDNVILEPVKGLFGVDKGKTLEKYQNELKSSRMALADLKEKRKRDELKIKSLSKGLARENQNVDSLKQKVLKIRNQRIKELNKIEEIILNPDKTNEWRNNIIQARQGKKEKELNKSEERKNKKQRKNRPRF